jgi:ComF family protein
VSGLPALAIRWTGRLIDALLPPRCLACGAEVDGPGGVCPSCWAGLRFIGPPCCSRCGLPFEFATPGETACGACLAAPPRFERARSVLVYDDASRPLILGFKHADRTHGAPAFGRWLARAGAEVLAGADLLAPVPLHRRRLFRRRYNQSALLARALADVCGVPADVALLERTRPTPTQGGLSREGRQRNVAGAFHLRGGREEAVRNKRIVLIDDVLTTGATLGECARALLAAGAARVDALTLARVVRG